MRVSVVQLLLLERVVCFTGVHVIARPCISRRSRALCISPNVEKLFAGLGTPHRNAASRFRWTSRYVLGDGLQLCIRTG